MIRVPSRRQLLCVVTALCAVATYPVPNAEADTRKVIIDARDKPLSEVRQEYEQAVLGTNGSRVVNRRIVILIDSKRGFDAGFLQVPRNAKIPRTHIELIPNGRTLRGSISVNLLKLNRARIYQINQSINIRK